MSKPVAISGELNLVHQGIDTSLIVIRAFQLLLRQDVVATLEVRIHHPVGETLHTDTNTLKHTVTGQLVHNKRRLNVTRLLVRVGHKTTHKVRLTAVQSKHQFVQGDKVDGRHGLAATALLLLLTLFFR